MLAPVLGTADDLQSVLRVQASGNASSWHHLIICLSVCLPAPQLDQAK
jgi:hypothetical protein